MPDATIQLRSLHGIWQPVYARRQALHTTADAIILAAWKRDTTGIDLGPAVAAWRQGTGESTSPVGQHRREAAAAAILATLAARPWKRTRAALALAAKRAHRAGWAAGHALVTRDHTDATDYDDQNDQPNSLGAPDLAGHTAEGAARSVLTAAMAATATRAGRAMADSTGDPEADAQDVLDDGFDLALAADAAVSAAYGTGLLAAYLNAGAQAVEWLTAGDGRVCERCIAAEDGSPYSLLGAPALPQHPHCRCVLAPV